MLLLFGVFSSLDAEELTLKKALETAMNNNLTVKTLKLQYANSATDHTIALLDFLPVFSAGVSYSEQIDPYTTGPDEWDYDYSLNGSVTLFSGGGKLLSLKEASLNQKAQKAATEDGISGVLLETEKLFYDTLLAEKNFEIAEEKHRSMEIILEKSEQKYQSKRISSTDYYNIRSQYSSADYDMHEKRNDAASAKRALALFLKIEDDITLKEAPYNIEGIIAAAEQVTDKDASRYIQGALSANRSLQNKELLMKASETQALAAKGNILPKITATYSHGWDAGESIDAAGGKITVSASMDVFPLFNKTAKAVKADRSALIQQYSYDDASASLKAEITESYEDLAVYPAALKAAVDKMSYAKLVYEQSVEKYEYDRVSVTDLIDAEVGYAEARYQFESTYYNMLKEMTNFAYLTGNDENVKEEEK